MWFCRPHILLISILAINVASWRDGNISPMMANAISPASLMPSGLPGTLQQAMSRRRELWTADGVRALSRGGRAVDPVNDSTNLPHCIDLCIASVCHGSDSITEGNTAAPTTES